MQINVTSAKVLIAKHGPDLVIVETDLPPTVFPYKENATPRFEVAKGQGADYVRTHLGIEPEVINIGE